MKKIVPILFVAAFALQLTASYWITTMFYVHRDYISTHICINRFDLIPVCRGSCYLEKKLGEHAAKQQRLPDLRPNEISLFHPVDGATLEPMLTACPEMKYPRAGKTAPLADFAAIVFRPPCAVA